MVYLKYVENVIPLSKLIGLLFLFCLPLLSILFLKTKRNDLARPVMGTIFLVTVVWQCKTPAFKDHLLIRLHFHALIMFALFITCLHRSIVINKKEPKDHSRIWNAYNYNEIDIVR